MGVQITELVSAKECKLEELKGRTFAVDTFNLLYQFLSSIRQPDGTLLTDSKGRVTSHLSGLFARFTNLMSMNMRFVFCFDGKVPELKKEEQQRRKILKLEAELQYEKAVAEEDVTAMRKFAARTSRLTPEMVEEAKKLIEALGQCIVEAPSEGEAQAARIVRNGHADYVISQDADCLLFGAPKMVKNMAITRRKKKPGAFATSEISPEVITLKDVLAELEITQDQLIALGMLVGTDYNVGGIKGIGPKKALAMVKRHGSDFVKLFEEAKWIDHFELPWMEVFDTIKSVKTTDTYALKWRAPDRDALVELLVKEHDFSLERVESSLARLESSADRKQKGLGDFL